MSTEPSHSPERQPHRLRQIAESFGVDAERYDRARPRYHHLSTTGMPTQIGPDQLATVLDGVGTAIDSMRGVCTVQYVTLAATAARGGDA